MLINTRGMCLRVPSPVESSNFVEVFQTVTPISISDSFLKCLCRFWKWESTFHKKQALLSVFCDYSTILSNTACMSAEGQDDGRGRLPAPMVQVPGWAAADGATVQQLESAHWIQVSFAATRRIWALIYPFSIEYTRLASMGRDELVDTTHCMMPCTFLEYQVFIICL